MSHAKPTYQELQTRLAELEQLVNALHQGEVDAVVGKRDVLLLRLAVAEKALQECEAHYRALVEMVPYAIVELDTSGVITFANKACCAMTGYAPDELVGTTVFDRPADETERLKLRDYWKHLVKDQPPPKTWLGVNRAKDGHLFDIHVDWDYQRDEQGNVTGFVAVATDVTEAHRTEEALRRTQFALDQAVEGVAWMGPDGRCHQVNETLCRSLGYSREELLDMSVPDLDAHLPAEDWPETWNRLKLAGSLVFESEHCTKDGRRIPVEVTAKYVEFDGQEYGFSLSRDITWRKQAEKALEKSEERFRLFFENSRDSMAAFTADLQRVWVNPAWQKVFGREQHSREEPLTVVHPEDLPELKEVWKGLVSDGQEIRSFEFRSRAPDGTWKNLEGSAFGIDHHEERLFYVIVHDITDRKRAEEALRQSAQELRIRNRIAEVFLTSSDDEIYAEVLAVVLEALQSEHGVFGYIDQQGALVAPSMTRDVWDQCRVPNKEFVFPRETWGGIWGRTLRENKTLYSNEPLHVSKGHIPMRRVLCVPIAYRDQPIGILEVANKTDDYDEEDVRLLETIARNIAPILEARLQSDRQEEERRHAEEALRDSEERFRAVFEQAASSVVLIDPEDGAIVESNEHAYRNLGYAREEFETLKISDFEVDKSVEQIRAHLKKTLAKGRDSFETRHRTKQGDVRNIVVQTRPILVRGTQFLLSVWHDITDRKQAEQRETTLRAELAHMGRVVTMGEMASGLAHELNQPLTAIATLAHVAAQTLRSGNESDRAQLAAMCDDIGAQAMRAGQLIRRMRSFVRKIVPQRTTLDLPEVLDEVFSLMENELRLAGVSLRLDLDPSLPTTFADKIQVEQVLLNLMRNALDSMERCDGDDHELSIAADARDGHLRICVRDTGVGIPRDKADELFGTFFTTKREGMGMGLAICRSIVEAHGGRIWAAPNDDRGATFAFMLPILDRVDKEGADGR